MNKIRKEQNLIDADISSSEDEIDLLDPLHSQQRAQSTQQSTADRSADARPNVDRYVQAGLGKVEDRVAVAGVSTIDEPIATTVRRAVTAVGEKCVYLLMPPHALLWAHQEQQQLVQRAQQLLQQIKQTLQRRHRQQRSSYEQIDQEIGQNDPESNQNNLNGQANQQIGQNNRIDQLLQSRIDMYGFSLRNWDLWGPLLFSLTISISLAMQKRKQGDNIFAMGFMFFWLGLSLCAMNISVIEAGLNVFQGVCALGYAACPLAVASVVASFSKNTIIRLILALTALSWSSIAAICAVESQKVPSNTRIRLHLPIVAFNTALAVAIITVK